MIEKIFANVNYTLVDSYELNKKTIHHFINEIDEKFCYKKNNEYQEITDKLKIEQLRIKYNLIYPEALYNDFYSKTTLSVAGIAKNLTALTEEEKRILLEFLIENLNKLNEKGENIDIEKAISRFEKLNVYKGDINNELVAGLYHPATNSVVLSGKLNEDKTYDSVILHELIHAIGGQLYHFNIINNYMLGFIEGRTELSCIEVNDKKQSCIVNGIHFNHASTSYHEAICMIQQLEIIMNKSSLRSVASGNYEFFDEFSQKYGKSLLRYIGHHTTRMSIFKEIRDPKQYFNMTQRKLLTTCFDQDFQNVKTFADIENYFAKLKKMQTVYAQIEGDTFFEEYYNRKLYESYKILLANNLEKDEAINKLKKLKYEQHEFNEVLTDDELTIRSIKNMIRIIGKYVLENDYFDIGQMECYQAKSGSDFSFMILNKGQVFLIEYGTYEISKMYIDKNVFDIPFKLSKHGDTYKLIDGPKELGYHLVNKSVYESTLRNGVKNYLEQQKASVFENAIVIAKDDMSKKR